MVINVHGLFTNHCMHVMSLGTRARVHVCHADPPPGSDADGNVVSVPEIDTRGKSRAAGSPPKRGKPPAKRRAGKKNSGSQAGSTEVNSVLSGVHLSC